jgi:hypothetical protein
MVKRILDFNPKSHGDRNAMIQLELEKNRQETEVGDEFLKSALSSIKHNNKCLK